MEHSPNKLYYVYVDRLLETNEPIYVGSGDIHRVNLHGRNKKWNAVTKKHAYQRTIVLKTHVEKEAREHEAKLIKELHTFIDDPEANNRRACNFTSGGEGHTLSERTKNLMRLAHVGRKFSAQHRRNISLSKMGSKNPMFGKKETLEHVKKRISSIRNKKRSAETCSKISKALKGKKSTHEHKSCIIVEQLTLDDKHIAMHKSIQAAARAIGNKSASNILYACKNTRSQAYGFHWRYAGKQHHTYPT